MITPEQGRIYGYKDRKYYVVSTDAKMKVNSVWLPCIIYYSLSDTSKLYSREFTDFAMKFKLI